MKKHFLLIAILFSSVFGYSQVPYNWFLDEVNPGMDFALSPDDTNPQEGMYACKMVLLQPEIPYLISDNFNVTAGDSYTFTIYYYDNDSRASLKFYADFYDAGGGDIYGEDPVYSEDSEGWQSVTWSATVPAGAVEGYILIKLYDDEGYIDEATVWVDNVSFVVNAENLVLNGSFELWPGVGIDEVKTEKINIYPNPVYDFISISNSKGIDKIEICNQLGQAVKNQTVDFENNIQIECSDLSSGFYFVSFYKGSEMIQTAKIIKK